jgi:hypothetical protein
VRNPDTCSFLSSTRKRPITLRCILIRNVSSAGIINKLAENRIYSQWLNTVSAVLYAFRDPPLRS